MILARGSNVKAAKLCWITAPTSMPLKFKKTALMRAPPKDKAPWRENSSRTE
jgi:hypothetical protein